MFLVLYFCYSSFNICLLFWLLSCFGSSLYLLIFFFFVSVSLWVYLCVPVWWSLLLLFFFFWGGGRLPVCSRLFVGWFDFLPYFFLSFFFPSVLCGLQSPDAPARVQAWHSEVGDLSPECWATKKLWTQAVLNRESSPKGLYLNSKTWSHPKAS